MCRRKRWLLNWATVMALLAVLCPRGAARQEPAPSPDDWQKKEAQTQEKPLAFLEHKEVGTHRFLDRTNLALFSGVAAVRVLDYTSTGYFRARGYSEGLLTNRIVDNKPVFAGIQVGAAATSVGISYWLHRHSHHKLERWLSLVHIGGGGFWVVRNYWVKGPPRTSLHR